MPSIGQHDTVAQEKIRQELETMLQSHHFARSGRQSALLRYLCERCGEGKQDQLKEYTIGVEVFNRRPGYSPSEDSIVRAQVHELRRRLQEYYAAEGRNAAVQVEIPKGSYCPRFTENRGSGRKGAASSETGLPGSWAKLPASWVVVLALLVMVIGLNTWLMIQFHKSSKAVPQTAALPKGEYDAYRETFGAANNPSGPETLVCLSNPKVLLFDERNRPAPSSFVSRQTLSLTPHMKKILRVADSIPYGEHPYCYLHPTSDEYTRMGEAACAYGLGRLLETVNVTSQITQFRFLNWSTASRENLIILGLPHVTLWTQQNISSRFFRMTTDSLLVRNAATGEVTPYTSKYDPQTGNIILDYGVISKETTAAGSAVLILAGLSSFGTYGVGQFFCNPEKMKTVFKELISEGKQGIVPANFLILLKIQVNQDIPISTSYVTALVDPSGRSQDLPVCMPSLSQLRQP